MSPFVFEVFTDLVAEHGRGRRFAAALEVGASAWTLLSMPAFAEARRVALNLSFESSSPELEAAEQVVGNGNDMPFADETFDCVLTSSTLEHDKYFWKTAAEIWRVLKPGGLALVGLPIYMTLPTDRNSTTITFARHGLRYNADYYRFSEQAMREVILEGYDAVLEEKIVRTDPNPYMIIVGRR